MYRLQVFYDGADVPHHTERMSRAADVISRIPVLLEQHKGCERIVVWMDATRLFAVDCEGATLPDQGDDPPAEVV